MSYESENSSSKLADTQQRVDEVALVMRENIDIALKNTEQIEMIEQKSEQLEAETNRFKKLTGKVKCKFCFDNFKTICIVALIIIIIILIILYAQLRSG